MKRAACAMAMAAIAGFSSSAFALPNNDDMIACVFFDRSEHRPTQPTDFKKLGKHLSLNLLLPGGADNVQPSEVSTDDVHKLTASLPLSKISSGQTPSGKPMLSLLFGPTPADGMLLVLQLDQGGQYTGLLGTGEKIGGSIAPFYRGKCFYYSGQEARLGFDQMKAEALKEIGDSK